MHVSRGHHVLGRNGDRRRLLHGIVVHLASTRGSGLSRGTLLVALEVLRLPWLLEVYQLRECLALPPHQLLHGAHEGRIEDLHGPALAPFFLLPEYVARDVHPGAVHDRLVALLVQLSSFEHVDLIVEFVVVADEAAAVVLRYALEGSSLRQHFGYLRTHSDSLWLFTT